MVTRALIPIKRHLSVRIQTILIQKLLRFLTFLDKGKEYVFDPEELLRSQKTRQFSKSFSLGDLEKSNNDFLVKTPGFDIDEQNQLFGNSSSKNDNEVSQRSSLEREKREMTIYR